MGSVGYIIHRVDTIDEGIKSGQGLKPDTIKIGLKLTQIKGIDRTMKTRVWLFARWVMIKHLLRKCVIA